MKQEIDMMVTRPGNTAAGGIRLAILICGILIVRLAASAAPGSVFTVPGPRPAAVRDRLTAIAHHAGPLEGEVAAVDDRSCVLKFSGGMDILPFSPDCLILANGIASHPRTIAPVTPETFFWARIWRDERGNALAVEAVYYGGELIVSALGPGWVSGTCPETGEQVALNLRGDFDPRFLRPGQSFYLLLDLDRRVRWAKML